jgi:hypothetical protein
MPGPAPSDALPGLMETVDPDTGPRCRPQRRRLKTSIAPRRSGTARPPVKSAETRPPGRAREMSSTVTGHLLCAGGLRADEPGPGARPENRRTVYGPPAARRAAPLDEWPVLCDGQRSARHQVSPRCVMVGHHRLQTLTAEGLPTACISEKGRQDGPGGPLPPTDPVVPRRPRASSGTVPACEAAAARRRQPERTRRRSGDGRYRVVTAVDRKGRST